MKSAIMKSAIINSIINKLAESIRYGEYDSIVNQLGALLLEFPVENSERLKTYAFRLQRKCSNLQIRAQNFELDRRSYVLLMTLSYLADQQSTQLSYPIYGFLGITGFANLSISIESYDDLTSFDEAIIPVLAKGLDGPLNKYQRRINEYQRRIKAKTQPATPTTSQPDAQPDETPEVQPDPLSTQQKGSVDEGVVDTAVENGAGEVSRVSSPPSEADKILDEIFDENKDWDVRRAACRPSTTRRPDNRNQKKVLPDGMERLVAYYKKLDQCKTCRSEGLRDQLFVEGVRARATEKYYFGTSFFGRRSEETQTFYERHAIPTKHLRAYLESVCTHIKEADWKVWGRTGLPKHVREIKDLIEKASRCGDKKEWGRIAFRIFKIAKDNFVYVGKEENGVFTTKRASFWHKLTHGAVTRYDETNQFYGVLKLELTNLLRGKYDKKACEYGKVVEDERIAEIGGILNSTPKLKNGADFSGLEAPPPSQKEVDPNPNAPTYD